MKRPTAESVTASLDLGGRTMIVTGASSGLGQEAARVLALRGARVIFACRNVEKGRAVVASLELPDEARGRCDVRACDLARQASVRSLLDSLSKDGRAVDAVLLNAGVFNLPFELTEDGLERTYASSFAGHFALLHGLLTRSLLAPTGRVVATLSEAVRFSPFLSTDLDLLVDPASHREKFSRRAASPNAKALTALVMQHFSRVAKSTRYEGASFDGCDPGATLTDNVNQGGPVLNALARAFSWAVFKPVEEGAAVLVWAATSGALTGGSGRIFTGALKEAPLPRRLVDPALAEAVWRATEERLGLSALDCKPT